MEARADEVAVRTSGGNRRVWAALVAVWACAVWWLSSRSDPAHDLGVTFHFADWVAHGIEYGAGGFLTFRALNDGRTRRAAVYAVLACVAWGVLDEFHQSFVPGRETSIHDVVADTVGAGLGTLLSAAWATRRPRGAG